MPRRSLHSMGVWCCVHWCHINIDVVILCFHHHLQAFQPARERHVLVSQHANYILLSTCYMANRMCTWTKEMRLLNWNYHETKEVRLLLNIVTWTFCLCAANQRLMSVLHFSSCGHSIVVRAGFALWPHGQGCHSPCFSCIRNGFQSCPFHQVKGQREQHDATCYLQLQPWLL